MQETVLLESSGVQVGAESFPDASCDASTGDASGGDASSAGLASAVGAESGDASACGPVIGRTSPVVEAPLSSCGPSTNESPHAKRNTERNAMSHRTSACLIMIVP